MMTEARAEVPETTIAATAAGDAPPSRAAKRFPDVSVTIPPGSAASLLTGEGTGMAAVDVGAHPSPALPACS
jgi:hypothetical protein